MSDLEYLKTLEGGKIEVISSEKNGNSIGWVNVADIKAESEIIPTTTKPTVTSSNIYQKYECGKR